MDFRKDRNLLANMPSDQSLSGFEQTGPHDGIARSPPLRRILQTASIDRCSSSTDQAGDGLDEVD